MRKLLILNICLLNTLLALGQIDKNSNGGIGTGGGMKMYYGAWGVFYNYSPKILNSRRIEFNAGVGIRQSFVFGVGTKYKLYSNLKNFEILFAVNYSYQVPGEFIYEVNDLIDYYKTAETQYLHYYLTGRLWLNEYAAIQLDCGYSQNIGAVGIKHSSGPNVNYNKVEKTLKSGILLGIDLIVFLKIRKKSVN